MRESRFLFSDDDERLFAAFSPADDFARMPAGDVNKLVVGVKFFIEDWTAVIAGSDPNAVVRRVGILYDRVLGPFERRLADATSLNVCERDIVDRLARASLTFHQSAVARVRNPGRFDLLARPTGYTGAHEHRLSELRVAYLAELNEVRSRTQHRLLRETDDMARRALRLSDTIEINLTQLLANTAADQRPLAQQPRYVYFILWNLPWAPRQHRLKIGSVSRVERIDERLIEHTRARRSGFKKHAQCEVQLLGWFLGDEYDTHRTHKAHATDNGEEFRIEGDLLLLVNRLLRRDPTLINQGWRLPVLSATTDR